MVKNIRLNARNVDQIPTERSLRLMTPSSSRFASDPSASTSVTLAMMAPGSWQRFVNRHTAGTGYRPAEYKYPPVLDTCNG
ncbi:MAG: hypothetical protein LBH13_10375 [Cellulomonadaceae bacterium]|nr:hypothetical protein [Cellulomonadaceae bacterium]